MASKCLSTSFFLVDAGYFGLNDMATTFSLSIINQSPRIYQVAVYAQPWEILQT